MSGRVWKNISDMAVRHWELCGIDMSEFDSSNWQSTKWERDRDGEWVKSDMTPMTDLQYVEEKGTKCPFCGSLEVEFNEDRSFHCELEKLYIRLYCASCEQQWEDEYSLIGYNNTI